VHISCDVIFDEGAQWAWLVEHGEAEDFVIEEHGSGDPVEITTTMSMTRASASPSLSPILPTSSSPSASPHTAQSCNIYR
jgi:hypothetical protein